MATILPFPSEDERMAASNSNRLLSGALAGALIVIFRPLLAKYLPGF